MIEKSRLIGKILEEYKKMKFLVVLSLFASMLLAGCGGGTPANNANANANVNKSTPAPVNALSSGADTDVKKKIEDAWKAKGCTGATVEMKDGKATLRGSVPEAKFGECVQAANEAAPGKIDNQLAKGK